MTVFFPVLLGGLIGGVLSSSLCIDGPWYFRYPLACLSSIGAGYMLGFIVGAVEGLT